ncbi:hypothetical protein BJY01DRAFT_261408 [Aspergillus pseudoustus]|uniref:NAD-dependent epimerase/dehydratase domain-containing protein n=1 Tax=Aspergillus pseudoustus TaxID=1810923 RepID=A0ABR4KF15_9EURO
MASDDILITGASGFLATHVVDAFLQAGYAVRGTVRSQETADKVRLTFSNFADKLSFAIVSDIAQPNAFDEAVKGVGGVIHTASPFQFQVDDNERDLLRPAIEGTKNLLRSIQKYAPDVKRVVITSSFAAMVDPFKGNRPGHTYNESDWNPLTYEDATKKYVTTEVAYLASKALAERAAWDFVAAEKPSFDLAAICPPVIYGPNTNYTASLAALNASSADIYRLMAPASKSSNDVPTNSYWTCVDVRDVAEAHLKAFQISEAGGQRFFIASGNFSYQQIADIMREEFPELRDRVPVGTPGAGLGGVELYEVDSSKSKRILGIKYRSLKETVIDSARSLLSLEQKA